MLEAVAESTDATAVSFRVTDPADGGLLLAGPYSGTAGAVTAEELQSWTFDALATDTLGVDCDGVAAFDYVFEATDGYRADTMNATFELKSDVVGDSATGSELYIATCATCHRSDGVGGLDIGGTPSADLSVRVPALDDEALTTVISDGFGTAMPSQYTGTQDIADVIAFLRLSFP
ncbi:MAG: cytochrome c [Pseudomonadota bacterium]|nr:cytochrome c [Pseudomonadota bacterium]